MITAGVLIAGKYRVSRKLGEGAMGSVWLAKNEVTDREFAIKVLLPEAAQAPKALARFLQEARVCGGLRHPSILEIYDAGTASELGGAPFLVMERLDGAPLDVVLRLRGALPPPLAIDIVAQISRGMELAHAKGVVHRDLKPANVFLHRPGSGALVPKVLDFGISKIVGGKTPEIALTNTSAILGSPSYMSPEQMTPEAELDARSDVHALGVLLWELLTGRAPFLSTSYNLLVVEIIRGPRPKLRDVMPAASRDLAAIVERSFAIEAGERFASSAALASALEGELAKLGGGVLAGRTAAVDVLGALDLSSNAPPPIHGSTTVPLSFDPASKLSPTLRSEDGLHRRDVAAVSFADTEVAAGGARVAPRGAAVSAERGTSTKTSSIPVRVGGGVVMAIAAAGVLMFAMRKAPKAPEPLGPEPAASAAAVVSAPVAPPSVQVAPAPPVLATAAPSVTASASAPLPAPRGPTPVSAPRKTPRASPAPSATAAPRPRIDQSGL